MWENLQLPICGGKEKIQGAGTGRFEGVGIPTLAGGTLRKECMTDLDTTGEMEMPERNEKGQQVRRYFIQVERKYKN